MEKPCHVFCYHAHEDKKYLDYLRKHLKPLERSGLATVQSDRDIDPGREWKQEIDRYLEAADIILLLVSPSFVASDYCFDEMQKAITRHKQGMARVVPIIIRPTDWRNTPLGELQCLPKNGKPVSTWPSTDEALLSITEEIRMLVQKLPMDIHADQKKEKLPMPPMQDDDDTPFPSSRNQRDKHAGKYVFNAPVYTKAIGDHNNIYEGGKDGIRSLHKGSEALWNGEYRLAKKELRTAVEEIDQEEQSKEAAEARYLQALAVLGNELPREKGAVAKSEIYELLDAAIKLDQSCRTYVVVVAMIETDIFEHNSLPERERSAYDWKKRANRIPSTTHDEELLPYLAHCQPRLYQQTWWRR